ncbi:MAG: hypothetical protein JRJ78_14145 [Deltaproteobacteria bacterium]|nr:hypothetical protein [Deltaproteobacteria bacterium]
MPVVELTALEELALVTERTNKHPVLFKNGTPALFMVVFNDTTEDENVPDVSMIGDELVMEIFLTRVPMGIEFTKKAYKKIIDMETRDDHSYA